LTGKSYFLSSPECFFHRYADTGFKNKWTGFWLGENKLLEFFAFKLGNEFLSEKNCTEFSYNYTKASHSHSVGRIKAVQYAWVPAGKPALVIGLSLNRETDVGLFLAANFRHRSENFHSRKYSVKERKNGFFIRSGKGILFLSALEGELSLKGVQEHKTHFPAGEKQCFFSPGRISLRGKELSLMLSPFEGIKQPKFEEKEKLYSPFASMLKSDSGELQMLFARSAQSMELLNAHDSYYAGLPWFSQYWGRDVFWSLPAVTELGFFERSKKSLLFFAKNSLEGQIPNFLGPEKSHNSIDATPLFLISLAHFISYSADKKFLGKIMLRAMQSIAFLEERISGDSLARHDSESSETWMDTLRRNDSAIEVQALALKALESFSEMLSISGVEESHSLNERAKALKKAFPKAFQIEKGLYADRIVNGKKDCTKRINALVPIFLGQIKSTEQFNLFESGEFTSKKGVPSISMSDARFRPESYHEGSVWSLGNAWLSAAAFALGDAEKGFSLLKRHCADLRENALGCIGETWNPVTGNLSGCALQLWASAFTIRIVDEFILGIKPNAFKKEIVLTPRLPKEINSVKRKIRLGKKEFILEVERKGSEIRAKSSEREIKVEVR